MGKPENTVSKIRLFLIAVALISLAGCGGGAGDADDDFSGCNAAGALCNTTESGGQVVGNQGITNADGAAADNANLASTTQSASAPPEFIPCLLYTSQSPRDGLLSRMPSSA